MSISIAVAILDYTNEMKNRLDVALCHEFISETSLHAYRLKYLILS